MLRLIPSRACPAALCLAVMLDGVPVLADPAQIEEITARRSGETWSFSVTLSHGDTGWDDFADSWRIELSDGTVLGTRDLLHPHVDEQPFTRSLTGVTIPDDAGTVEVRARTNKDGWSKEIRSFELP